MSAIARADAKLPPNFGSTTLYTNAIWPSEVTGVFAGLAGGLAEVIWIGAYSRASETNGFDIARQVADTVFPGVLRMPVAPTIGLAIHFGLSAIIGFLLVRPLVSAAIRRSGTLLPICLGILGLIWFVNFRFVLPVLNPTFPALLPNWVTLLSKFMFGAALAGVIGLRSMNFSSSSPQV